MPDLLVVTSDNHLADHFVELAQKSVLQTGKKCEFRAKVALTPALGQEWAATSIFDLVLFDQDLDDVEVEILTEKLWKKSPAAEVVIFNKHTVTEEDRKWKACVLGAEYVFGATLEKKLEGIFARVARRKLEDSKDFKLLVVEDLDSPRDVICSYIENLGYPKVQGVSSVKEALKILESNPKEYSCVITDINMPDINGKDFIRSLRAHKNLQHLPVVVVTAYGSVDNLVDCLKVGASGFLVKPPSRKQLEKELSRALRIALGAKNPRLANAPEVEQLMGVIIERGLI